MHNYGFKALSTNEDCYFLFIKMIHILMEIFQSGHVEPYMGYSKKYLLFFLIFHLHAKRKPKLKTQSSQTFKPSLQNIFYELPKYLPISAHYILYQA